MKYLLLLTAIVFIGCGPKEVFIDRPVYIDKPVKCKIPTPVKPDAQDNGALNITAIKFYIKDLENALESCR